MNAPKPDSDLRPIMAVDMGKPITGNGGAQTGQIPTQRGVDAGSTVVTDHGALIGLEGTAGGMDAGFALAPKAGDAGHKPRLRCVRGKIWSCSCAFMKRQGMGWRQAYQRWLIAAIIDAQRRLGTPVVKKTIKRKSRAKKPGQAAKRAPAPVIPSAAAPRAPKRFKVQHVAPGVRVHRIEEQESPAPRRDHLEGSAAPARAKRPQPKGDPYIGIKAREREPAPRPEYKPPESIRLAAARAARYQPPLISISTAKTLESNV